jgi:hypothetical protein
VFRRDEKNSASEIKAQPSAVSQNMPSNMRTALTVINVTYMANNLMLEFSMRIHVF